MPIRLLAPAFLLVLFLATAAHADPLVIAGGQFVVEGEQSTSINISGLNFDSNFTFSAFNSAGSTLNGARTLAGGSNISLGGTQRFNGIGSLCYNGNCVSDNNTGDGTVSGEFTFVVASFLFPPIDPNGPTTYTVSEPFWLTGTVSGSGSNFPETTLLVMGQGQITFTYEIFFDNGSPRYGIRRVETTFTDTTPEPATLLLLTTGLAGAAAARRRRRR